MFTSIAAGAAARSRRGRAPSLLGALALLGAAAPLHAEAARAPAAPPARLFAIPVPLPRADDGTEAGRAALVEASAAKRAAQKLEGDSRTEALAGVAKRYEGIAATDAFAAFERAEAAFRGGEVFRSIDLDTEAESLFSSAVTLGEPSEAGREFAARAMLERAHLRRRAEDADGALSLYAQVGARFADQRRQAAHARTWTGKVLLTAGRLQEAALHLQGFAEVFPEYGPEAVRNADLLAVAQAEAGDETAARDTIERVRREVEPVLAKGGKAAEETRSALDALRVTEILGGY
jgi:tetratricopeptide (TPR) repeat protein